MASCETPATWRAAVWASDTGAVARFAGGPWPHLPHLPELMPDLSAGLCQPGRTALPADAWLSDDRELREAAVWACRGCTVLADCRGWALTLPPRMPGVVGGMTKTGRERARQQARQQQQAPEPAPAAATTVPPEVRHGRAPEPAPAPVAEPARVCACGCGEPLGPDSRADRRFIDDRHRKRTQRRDERAHYRELRTAAADAGAPGPGPVPQDRAPVTEAFRSLATVTAY